MSESERDKSIVKSFKNGSFFLWGQKKKDEEKAREQELNELFKVAISQPKVPVGMYVLFHDIFLIENFCLVVDIVSLVRSLWFL